MKVNYSNLLGAFCYALDCVENELMGGKTGHSRRVAYICVRMGNALGLSKSEILDLTACALLHDNALSEFIYEEYKQKKDFDKDYDYDKNLGIHCIIGERNLMNFPFQTHAKGTVLYHHENESGTGPFRKSPDEVNIYSRLIHFADKIDTDFSIYENGCYQRDKIKEYLMKLSGLEFPREYVEVFLNIFNEKELSKITADDISERIYAYMPESDIFYSKQELKEIAKVFAKIIDYKSEVTSNHSLGIADKTEKMGKYYGYDEDKISKLYIAAALHDVGKLSVKNSILEKPARLNIEEFEEMKEHAMHTYRILSSIGGFEEITPLASRHHEKLDGTGYPFGLKGDELSFDERLIGCIDIYQALTEKRQYKDGMSHKSALTVLRDMASKGLIDKRITEDIDCVFIDKR